MQPLQLSKADSKVLAQVFDPESAPERTEILIDPSLPADPHIHDADLLATLRQRESEAIKLVEKFEKSQQRPSSTTANTESKDATFTAALSLLDALITSHPTYASARNNRAQLRRWRFSGGRDRHFLVQRRGAVDAALREAGAAITADLQTAIRLASPPRPTDAVAPAQGRVLAQAYTQMGAILHVAGKDLAEILRGSKEGEEGGYEGSLLETPPEPFEGWDTVSRFEEEASRLFYLGGLFGNEVAKALAVHANPHAKLCGSIVQEALRKEMSAGS